jgi:hypothetical protein
MSYLLGLIGITLLCAAWMKFQLWLKRVSPERQDFRPGCGACQSGSCGAGAETETTTIKINQIHLPQEAGFEGTISGVDECNVKRSP